MKREKERVREMEGGQSKEKSEIFSVPTYVSSREVVYV